MTRHAESPRPPRLSLVVPCRDEAENLQLLFERCRAAAEGVAGAHWELVLVDDGSTDGTWEAVAALAAADKRVRGLSLTRNFGQPAAAFAGLRASRGARVLLLDADLQDPPELLPELMAALDEGADLALARRRRRPGEPLHRRLGAWCFYRLLNLLAEREIPADVGDFRLMSRRFVDDLAAMQEPEPYLKGLSSWVGYAVREVPFDRAPRRAGRTKYGLASLMRLSLEAVTAFSLRPLRLAWVFAGLFALLCLIAALAANVAGAALFFVAAVQSLLLALLGEYVGRLHLAQKGRPLYLVRETTEAAGAAAGPAGAEATAGPSGGQAGSDKAPQPPS